MKTNLWKRKSWSFKCKMILV